MYLRGALRPGTFMVLVLFAAVNHHHEWSLSPQRVMQNGPVKPVVSRTDQMSNANAAKAARRPIR
jgi:hypothetical protein